MGILENLFVTGLINLLNISGQDILFWQSGSMRELAESNPRLLSLSTLYPVAKEDFVLHLFYAHKGEEKLVMTIGNNSLKIVASHY